MKNSKEYSKKIVSLFQSLKRKNSKVEKVSYDKVEDALIYGIISEKLTEKDTAAAMKRFHDYFVDWNDLRVSRFEEIAELLGADTPENRQIAISLTKVLNTIYSENHQVSLDGIHKLGKRPARQKLEKMEGLSLFAIDYCMLTSLSSHAIPLTETMIEYLKNNELIDADADAATTEGFLAKQVAAKDGYEFYALLRHESETNTRTAKKQAKTEKEKPAKKTAKKTTTVKKVTKAKKVAKDPTATKTKRKK